MKRRNPPRPSPDRDWRAVAADRPQRRLPVPLPVVDDAAPPDALADVDLRVRRRPGGGRCLTLAARVTLVDAGVVRALAERLLAAARSLEAGDPGAAPSNDPPASPPTGGPRR